MMLDRETRKKLAYVVRAQSLDDVQELLSLYFESPNSIVTLTVEPVAMPELPEEIERLLNEGFSVMVERDGELIPVEDAVEPDEQVGIEAPVAWFIEACGGYRKLAKEVWRALRAGRPSLAPRPPRWILTDTREWWVARDEAEAEMEHWIEEERQPDPLDWIPVDLNADPEEQELELQFDCVSGGTWALDTSREIERRLAEKRHREELLEQAKKAARARARRRRQQRVEAR